MPHELEMAVKASKRTFLGLAVFSVFTGLLMLTGPLYMLQVYDGVLASNSVPTLVALTVLTAGLFLVLGVLNWLRSSLFDQAGSRLEETMASRALDVACRNASCGEPASGEKVMRDLRTLRRFYSSPALQAVFDMPMSPLFFGVLFLLHWSYGVWAIIGTIIIVGLGILNQRGNQTRLVESEKRERASNLQIAELVNGIETSQSLGMTGNLTDKWRRDFDESDRLLSQSSDTLSAFREGTKAFRLFLQSSILGLGAYLVIIQISTPGAMIAASIIMGRAIAPIEIFIGQWRLIVQAKTSWTSLRQGLEANPVEAEPMAMPPITGKLSVQGVYGGAPGLEVPTLKGISFDIKSGEAVGIIGPSAAGKSSLAKLLTGYWTPTGGEVRFDGASLKSYSKATIGRQIGYLPQSVQLFSGSISENISRFEKDADPQRILEAASMAGCHEMIVSIDGGYDAIVGVGGAHLSGGQKQRIGLARALYGNPRFIVLDEPNSNLDGQGDQALQNAVLEAKKGGTTIVIVAHRPSTLKHCDKLLILDKGRIANFGERETVLAELREVPKSVSMSGDKGMRLQK